MKTPHTLPARRVAIMALLAAALSLSAGLALAGGEGLPRSVVASGGPATASGYQLHSAIGQPAAGGVQNGAYLCSGFLCGPSAPGLYEGLQRLFLPLILRD
jgi:hypothetical protein